MSRYIFNPLLRRGFQIVTTAVAAVTNHILNESGVALLAEDSSFLTLE